MRGESGIVGAQGKKGDKGEKGGGGAAVVRSSTIGPLNKRTNQRNKERGEKTIELLHIAAQ